MVERSASYSPDTTDPLLRAIAAGHSALLVVGNIHDFVVMNGKVVYRLQHIADQLSDRGYAVIRFSKSQGGRVHSSSALSPVEKETLDSRLNAVGLQPLLNRDTENGPNEIRNFFRAAARLLQGSPGGSKPVALMVDYGEHLAPAAQSSAAAAEEHTIVAETLNILANAPALRKSANLVLAVVRDGYYNTLLNDLHRVEYPFPDETQTRAFIQHVLVPHTRAASSRYRLLEENFGEDELARLTRGLRIRDVEAMIRETQAANSPLTRNRVLEAKAEAIRRASEGTLSVMSTNLTMDELAGLDVMKRIMRTLAEKLRVGDPSSPRAILFAGSPGTAKSTIPPILANLCGFNCLRFENLKNLFVGESERRIRLALSLVDSLSPAILFIDEITEAIPGRSSTVMDGGVSLDLLGQLFSFSARDELRGRVLLMAASNVPERLDPAWHDRFIVIPFFELLPADMCKLFEVFERRATGSSNLDARDSNIIEASQILHRKGASPRKILDIVSHALLRSTTGVLTSKDVLAAAQDYLGSGHPMAVAYTSLVALSLTSFRSLLPWSDDPKHYRYPWYLDGVVEKESGEIDRKELHRRIHEYRQHANV